MRFIAQVGSSLIYNTSARHERHECNTNGTNPTRVQHECNMSETGATRVQHKWRECVTSATQTARERHEWKNFDFDNCKSKNIFSYSYIYYMASEILQGEEQFHSKNYLLEMPRSHAKMCLKSPPQKLNFLMAKDISKRYTLARSCTLMALQVPA